MLRHAKVFFISTLVVVIMMLSLLGTRISVVDVPNSLQDINLLLLEGISLDPPIEPAKISKITALKNAWSRFGKIGMNRVTIEYHLVTIRGTDLKMQPTYIISFRGNPGWLPPSAGPNNEVSLHTELNVFVDATSGKAYRAFEYR